MVSYDIIFRTGEQLLSTVLMTLCLHGCLIKHRNFRFNLFVHKLKTLIHFFP